MVDSEKLKLFSNGGTTYFEKQGTCNILPIKVWFNEKEKVRLLFSKSQNNHPELKQEIIICRQQYDTFSDAVIYLKNQDCSLKHPNLDRGVT